MAAAKPLDLSDSCMLNPRCSAAGTLHTHPLSPNGLVYLEISHSSGGKELKGMLGLLVRLHLEGSQLLKTVKYSTFLG